MRGLIKMASKNLLPLVTVGAAELIVILVILFALVQAGYGFTIIISPSMSPLLRTNSMVFTYAAPYESLQVGDIIKYQTKEQGAVMHRIKQKNEFDGRVVSYLTKGDNNLLFDSWIVNKDTYQSKVIWYANELAPVITAVFGKYSDYSANKISFVFGLVSLGVYLVFMLVGKLKGWKSDDLVPINTILLYALTFSNIARLVYGVVLIVAVMIFVLGGVSIGFWKATKYILKGVKSHEHRRITNRGIYDN